MNNKQIILDVETLKSLRKEVDNAYLDIQNAIIEIDRKGASNYLTNARDRLDPVITRFNKIINGASTIARGCYE